MKGVGMNLLPGRRVRWAALGAIVGALAVGGVAWADIPDSGVIQGCYKASGGALRLIDTSAGTTCNASERPVSWNQTGPTGPTEGVGSTASIGSPPTTLTNQMPVSFASTLTTTVRGQLHLTKSVDAGIDCLNSGLAWWWITLDGASVRSSLSEQFALGGSTSPRTLIGVTAAAIPAGTHTMDVDAMCDSGPFGGYSSVGFSQGTAIVLG